MASTIVIIQTSDQEFTLPGTQWTAEQVITSFSANVPGIANMAYEETTSGDDKVFTFRPRTGTKG